MRRRRPHCGLYCLNYRYQFWWSSRPFFFHEIAGETSHTIYFAKRRIRATLKNKTKKSSFVRFFNGKKYQLNAKKTFLTYSLQRLGQNTKIKILSCSNVLKNIQLAQSQKIIIDFILVVSLCPLKIDVNFKIIIKFVINYY